jgi:hypothetical protein
MNRWPADLLPGVGSDLLGLDRLYHPGVELIQYRFVKGKQLSFDLINSYVEIVCFLTLSKGD